VDRAGVYYIIGEYPYRQTYGVLMFEGVLENLASQASIAEKIGQDSAVLSWLLSRIQQKEAPLTQNKQYAAEILAILLQSSAKNREKFMSSEGVDILLQLLSQYRKRDPEKDSDEEEYVENLFDCLICLVDEETGKSKFLEGEGVELAQIMIKEGKFSKQRALRVLDHALSGLSGASACDRLVEVAGLRTVFGMFMKKVSHSCWLGAATDFD
jgi:beta-catenin-like protein 1